jgi:hypothetical protein
VTSELLTNDGQIKWQHYPNYFLFGKGPLATTGCDRGAFVNTRGKWLFSTTGSSSLKVPHMTMHLVVQQ